MGASCSSQSAVGAQDHDAHPLPAKGKAGPATASSSNSSSKEVVGPSDAGSLQEPASSKAEPKICDEGSIEEDRDEKPRNQASRTAALARCFAALDKDQSGHIDSKEVKQYLFKAGAHLGSISMKARGLMKKLDVDSDDLVSQDEFVNMMDALMADKSDDDLEVWVAEVIYTASSKNVVGFGDGLGEVLSTIHLTPEQLSKLKMCFHALDNDNSGFVEMEELKVYLSKSGLEVEDMAEQEVQALMQKLDKNADGKVSEQEFYVTLSVIRRSVLTDRRFNGLVDNILQACLGDGVERPALSYKLLNQESRKT